MDDDSSSDWDSLTEPAPKLKVNQAKEEFDSDNEKKGRKSSSPTIIPPSKGDSPVWTPRKTGKPSSSHVSATSLTDDAPPHDFRQAVSADSLRNKTPQKRPGKDRKGNTYDPKPLARESSSHSRHDDDEEGAILADLRQTYQQNRPRNDKIAAPSSMSSAQDVSPKRKITSPETTTELKSSSTSRLGSGPKSQVGLTVEQKPSVGAMTTTSGSVYTDGQTFTVDDTDVVVETSSRYDDGRHSNRTSDPRRQHTNDSLRSNNLLVVDSSRSNKKIDSTQDKSMTVYYFDEAHTNCYFTHQERSVAVMESWADKAELAIQRGWKEVFAVLRIAVTMVTVFIAELVKFVAGSLLRPLLVTPITIISDRLLKPFFSASFNGFIQPFMILAYNGFVGLRLAVGPLLTIMESLTNMAARILGAFRLVDVHYHYGNPEQRYGTVQTI